VRHVGRVNPLSAIASKDVVVIEISFFRQATGGWGKDEAQDVGHGGRHVGTDLNKRNYARDGLGDRNRTIIGVNPKSSSS